MKTNITVIDSIMGSSKTTYAINYIKDNPTKNILYITPFLEEIDRIQKECPEMKSPKALKGRKLEGMKKLIIQGGQICSTHSLLSKFDLETQEALEFGEYELILDEVTQVVSPFKFDSPSDEQTFFEYLGYKDEDGYLCWREDINPIETYQGRYLDLAILCRNRNLIQIGNNILLWELPIQIFNKFAKVTILTYLFNGSYQKSYFDFFDIKYEYKSIKNRKLVEYAPTSREDKDLLRELITIVDNEKLNSIGEGYYNLSLSWYEKHLNERGKLNVFGNQIKLHIENFFKNIVNGKSAENLWSVWKNYQHRLKGNRYSKGYLPFNTRATNLYREKKNIAYMVNIFPHGDLVTYFSRRGINIDYDTFALNIMLQFIWRSRIRNDTDTLENRKITLYLPSKRMRNILLNWLEN